MKKIIIAVVITAIFCIGGTVVATNLISAEQINYDENTTVKDKIDDLYTTVDELEFKDMFVVNNNNGFSIYLPKAAKQFDYFNITLSSKSDTATCTHFTSNVTTKINDISLNTDYSTSTSGVSDYRLNFNATNGWCVFIITYHN